VDARPKTIADSSKRFISSRSKAFDGARCRIGSDTGTSCGNGSTGQCRLKALIERFGADDSGQAGGQARQTPTREPAF
jgi:hypothetical protein